MEKDLKQTDNLPPRKPPMYDTLKKIAPEHDLVKRYDKDFAEYSEKWKKETPNLAEYEKKILEPKKELPELFPIDFNAIWNAFPQFYELVNKCKFDDKANDGEGKIFAKTMIYYFLKDERFLKSPLISDVTIPSINKGVAIVGKWGNGKTSIMKTLWRLS